jgi:serine/threonine protein kinase
MQDDQNPPNRICVQCRQLYSWPAQACPVDGAMLIPIAAIEEGPDPLLDTVLHDRYQILSILGKGGMGVVYKGKHLLIDRIVAIKMLRTDVAYDQQNLMRFQVEAKAASRLNHPNVLAVYDFGVTDDVQPYLVMDYVEGACLAEAIERHGSLDYKRVLGIFIQACNALEHAHNQNILHRDIKPSNIFLLDTEGQKDFVKVLDFGIAKLMGADGQGLHLTKTGDVIGSPLYMSPEQCMGQELDVRSDIYSLGATMYECLVGAPPLMGKNAMDTISKHVNEPPKPFTIARPSVSVPPEIEAIVMKSLEKDKAKRYSSMLQFKEVLEDAASGRAAARAARPASQYAGVDLRKQIEEAEVPVSNIQVSQMQARAKTARMLDVEKEPAKIQINRLKDSAPPSKNFPMAMVIATVLALMIAGAATVWFLVIEPSQTTSPNTSIQKPEPPAKPGKHR